MSAFDEEVMGDMPDIFADAGVAVDYQGAGFAAHGVHAIKDDSHEVYDQDQVAMRVTTISVQCADVPSSKQGDQIVMPSRTWTVQQTLEDDGHVRRLWVS
ncbi:hypothetical protein [Halomonas sp. BMC6]|uniref:head-tail joining protein n=1 Tax=Halomonas sp. BMC6 TaxID=3073244 RepID=UPI0030D050A1